MQAIIDIFVSNGKKQSFIARKSLDLPSLPCKQFDIEDSVWRDATKKIEAIVLNLDDGAVYINLEPDTVVNVEQSKQIYESRGWQTLAYKTC